MKVVVLISSSTCPYSFSWVVVGSSPVSSLRPGLKVPEVLEDVLCGLLSVSTRAHWRRHQRDFVKVGLDLKHGWFQTGYQLSPFLLQTARAAF
jgi:hypothetical protein